MNAKDVIYLKSWTSRTTTLSFSRRIGSSRFPRRYRSLFATDSSLYSKNTSSIPQIRISLDITVALVGVATPGVGITTYEAAAENTISNQIVFHGYDAAIDFASSIDPAVAIAGSISKGIAVANAINDATKIIDAVTSIVNEVNSHRRERYRVSREPVPTARFPRRAAETTPT